MKKPKEVPQKHTCIMYALPYRAVGNRDYPSPFKHGAFIIFGVPGTATGVAMALGFLRDDDLSHIQRVRVTIEPIGPGEEESTAGNGDSRQ